MWLKFYRNRIFVMPDCKEVKTQAEGLDYVKTKSKK